MNSTNAKSIFWKVIPISLLLLLVGSMSFVLTPVNAGTSNSGLPPAYIEIRAVRNYGIWVAPYETTSSVITMITNMRASTGNRSLNLYAIVSGPQSPTETVGTTTLDSFLVQAK